LLGICCLREQAMLAKTPLAKAAICVWMLVCLAATGWELRPKGVWNSSSIRRRLLYMFDIRCYFDIWVAIGPDRSRWSMSQKARLAPSPATIPSAEPCPHLFENKDILC
jgi:hypothetical protein